MKKRVKILLFGLVVVASISLASTVVFAKFSLSPEELQIYSANNILFYEPCTTGGSNSGSPCAAEVSGSTIEEKIWSGLTAFLSEEQAAGVMGNMAHEGGFNPARHETSWINSSPNFPIATNTKQSYGIGLIQWSFGRRVNLYNFLKENGAENLWIKYIDEGRETYGRLSGSDFLTKAEEADVNALIAQELCFLKQELDNNESYKGIYNAKTVQEAADYFLEKVEIPGNIEATRPGRRTDAQKYYDQFHGKTITGGGGGNSSGPSCVGKGSMNINATAVALAWPYGTDNEVWEYVGSAYGAGSDWFGGKATDAFNQAFDDDDVYGPNSNDPHENWGHCPSIGASCDVGVGTVVRYSGVDPDFPRGLDEGKHVKSHPEIWEVLDSSTPPQAGDVVDVDSHIYIVAQDKKGDFWRVESGLCGWFWHVSRKFPGFESHARVYRAKNAINSNAGVDVERGVETTSANGVTRASGSGNGDIGASAIELAYPEDTDEETIQKTPFAAFVNFFSTLGQSKTDAGTCFANGKSCDRFAATVIRYSGVDENMNFGPVSNMLKYVEENPDWEKVAMKDPKKLDEYQSGDLVFFYIGDKVSHVGIYAKDSNGKGHVVQASLCEYFGVVKDTTNITSSSYFTGTRAVYRNKKNKNSTGTTCNVCGSARENDSSTGLKEGGMTLSEAQEWIKTYSNAAMGEYYKVNKSITFEGAYVHDDNCPFGVLNSCTALSQWFLNKYTSLGPKDAPATNGSEMVGALKNKGLETGTEPRPYAVFSNTEWSGYGHTGVVLGVDTTRKKVVIAEASCSMGQSSVYYAPRAKEESFDRVKNWTFAYTDKVLNKDGVGK